MHRRGATKSPKCGTQPPVSEAAAGTQTKGGLLEERAPLCENVPLVWRRPHVLYQCRLFNPCQGRGVPNYYGQHYHGTCPAAARQCPGCAPAQAVPCRSAPNLITYQAAWCHGLTCPCPSKLLYLTGAAHCYAVRSCLPPTPKQVVQGA